MFEPKLNKPRAYLRISSIGTDVVKPSGVFLPGEDVELRSEKLHPLYDLKAIQEAFEAGMDNGVTITIDGYYCGRCSYRDVGYDSKAYCKLFETFLEEESLDGDSMRCRECMERGAAAHVEYLAFLLNDA